MLCHSVLGQNGHFVHKFSFFFSSLSRAMEELIGFVWGRTELVLQTQSEGRGKEWEVGNASASCTWRSLSLGHTPALDVRKSVGKHGGQKGQVAAGLPCRLTQADLLPSWDVLIHDWQQVCLYPFMRAVFLFVCLFFWGGLFECFSLLSCVVNSAFGSKGSQHSGDAKIALCRQVSSCQELFERDAVPKRICKP